MGGVICGECGNGTLALSSAERRRFRAMLGGDSSAFEREALRWVAAFVRPHGDAAADALEGAATHWQ
jgi:hypothetical protein